MVVQPKVTLKRVRSRLLEVLTDDRVIYRAILVIASLMSGWLVLTGLNTWRTSMAVAESANIGHGLDLHGQFMRTCEALFPTPVQGVLVDRDLEIAMRECLQRYAQSHPEVLFVAAGAESYRRAFLGIDRADVRVSVGNRLAPWGIDLEWAHRGRPFRYGGRSVLTMPPDGRTRGPFRLTHRIEYHPARAEILQQQGIRALIASLLGAPIILGGALLIGFLLRQREAAQRIAREQEHLALVGRMSAVMAHELRNPLASAKGRSELLLEMLNHDPALQKRAQHVMDEIVRVELVTRQLLDFVRSGRVNIRNCDPVKVARDAIERVPGAIAIELEGKVSDWRIDPYATERALTNVLLNAAQAQEGATEPVVLTVACRDGQLFFSVLDHGPGFPDGIDLGAPFVTTRVGGTGLGLAVTRQIVQAHGGTLTLGKGPGAGALVEIRIPSFGAAPL